MKVTNGSSIDQKAKLCQVCIQILMWSTRQRSTSHCSYTRRRLVTFRSAVGLNSRGPCGQRGAYKLYKLCTHTVRALQNGSVSHTHTHTKKKKKQTNTHTHTRTDGHRHMPINCNDKSWNTRLSIDAAVAAAIMSLLALHSRRHRFWPLNVFILYTPGLINRIWRHSALHQLLDQ